MQIYVGDIKTHLNSQKQASEWKMLESQKPLSVPIKIQLPNYFSYNFETFMTFHFINVYWHFQRTFCNFHRID